MNQRPARPLPEQLLTSTETATMLGLQPQTLRVWRLRGQGPQYVRLGSSTRARVAYRLSVVQAWLDNHTFRNTSEETVIGL
jgi:predicted DNA-binding transcriptional regulator AlpA